MRTNTYPQQAFTCSNSRNTKTICEVCSKLTIKTPQGSGVFFVDFEQISHTFMVLPLLTLNKYGSALRLQVAKTNNLTAPCNFEATVHLEYFQLVPTC